MPGRPDRTRSAPAPAAHVPWSPLLAPPAQSSTHLSASTHPAGVPARRSTPRRESASGGDSWGEAEGDPGREGAAEGPDGPERATAPDPDADEAWVYPAIPRKSRTFATSWPGPGVPEPWVTMHTNLPRFGGAWRCVPAPRPCPEPESLHGWVKQGGCHGVSYGLAGGECPSSRTEGSSDVLERTLRDPQSGLHQNTLRLVCGAL
jgi:hypothetical protein